MAKKTKKPTTKTREQRKIDMATKMLKGMLRWSQRIGSDEIIEIREIIQVLQPLKKTKK